MNRPVSLPRVGKLFILGFEGESVPPWLVEFSRRFGLGGVILFARNCQNVETVRNLCREVKNLRDPVDGAIPFVCVDQEGGRVERIRDGVPRLPPARELARRTVEETAALAEEQSRALRALGIDLNLAPVCDVVRPGESGAIGDRAFGTDVKTVSAYAAAFFNGMRRGGTAACAKHFPGHGASAKDTHLGAGLVDLPREELFAVDVSPFRALVAEGVESVMACHLVYPAVDSLPATLSKIWIEEILRGELGFRGAVLTDDMEMGALSALGTPGELALRALEAGADLLIYGRMLKKDLDPADVAAYLESRVSSERVARSAARSRALRRSN